jgi:hypothetical protein
MVFDFLLQEPDLFVCSSIGTHDALDLDPKKEGESVRNKEEPLNTDGKYDEERREPKKIHDDLGELIVVFATIKKRKSTRDN